jgi:phosphoesterase RecJ-like protein
MQKEVLDFIGRHPVFIATTHQNADADGLGAELVFAQICRDLGKTVRIVNADPVMERIAFIDPRNEIEVLGELKTELPAEFCLAILDTGDEYNIGTVRDIIPRAGEVFVIDHHEPNRFSALTGLIDSTASSTCELMVELAAEAGVTLNPVSAAAAYAGIIYDTGSFAYSKTTARTFRAAISLLEAGVKPYEIYGSLNESAPTTALLLQKQVLSTLEILNRGRIAVQILRKEDLLALDARFEDAEALINIPLKSRDIRVSILVKENREGQVRCSLRSKGEVNVSKIAQLFGGGGHVSAAGFKSRDSIEITLANVLNKIYETMEIMNKNG